MNERTPNRFLEAAHLYDLDFRDHMTADLPFYAEYAGRLRGPVLELGCGTGRVALHLAREGHRVTALDVSEPMLSVFQGKLAAAAPEIRERIDLLRGDMADFRLDRRYALVVAPFRVFQALTEDSDIRGCLRCVREHLAEGGRFIVNVFRPNKTPLDESWPFPDAVQWERDDPATGRRIVKKHRGERIDTVRQITYPTLTYEVTEPDGEPQRFEEPLAMKYWYHDQFTELMKANGFRVLEEYGWYDKSAIENGRELILVCAREEDKS